MGYITAFFILLAAFGFIELSIRIALVEFYIGHMNEIELKFLQSQLTALKIESEALKNESEALRQVINGMRHQQKLSEEKIGTLITDLKNRDEFLKDIDKRTSLFHEMLKNTLNQMNELVEHVEIMDKQIKDISKELCVNMEFSIFSWGKLIVNYYYNLLFYKREKPAMNIMYTLCQVFASTTFCLIFQ